jgi:hypothetical protein
LIRISGRAGTNNAQKRSTTAPDIVCLVLRELASAHAAKYAIVVIVRHEILLPDFWGVFSKHPGQIKSCQNVLLKQVGSLCIYAAVWIADSAGHKHGQTRGNKAAGNLIHFFLGQLTRSHPAENPIIITRHNFSFPNLRPSNLANFILPKFC